MRRCLLECAYLGVWLNWTDKPKPVGELSYTELSTFEQAAAHIRTLL